MEYRGSVARGSRCRWCRRAPAARACSGNGAAPRPRRLAASSGARSTTASTCSTPPRYTTRARCCSGRRSTACRAIRTWSPPNIATPTTRASSLPPTSGVPSIVRLTACGWTSSTSCKSTACCPSTMTRSSRGTFRFSRANKPRERSASSASPSATPKTPRTPRCAAPPPTATSTRQWSATTCCTKEPSGTSSPPPGPRILASSS